MFLSLSCVMIIHFSGLSSFEILCKFKVYEGLPRWLRGKESSCQCRRCRRWVFSLWVGKIPWRRKWQPTPVFFFFFFLNLNSQTLFLMILELGSSRSRSYSCLNNLMDRGAWPSSSSMEATVAYNNQEGFRHGMQPEEL